MIAKMTSARRVRVRALQTSGVALALALGTPAFAQCAPDPTQENGTTTCTGTDADGLRVTTYGTTVSVPTGAVVQGNGQPAIAIALPSTGFGSAVTVSVAGQVDGDGQAGVSLLWQPPANGFGYTAANLNLTVTQDGTVSGSNALVVGLAGSGYGYAYATIDNSGTLTGTSGIALLSTAPAYAGFSSIANRATGQIGAISGPVGTLDNAGTLDGGTRSAVDWGTTYLFSGTVTNAGTIAATSSAATLANLRSNRTVTNSGLIANRGAGVALAGDSFTIANAAGGRITTAGTIAIQADTVLSLTNAGTITGDVVAAAQPNFTTGSTVDSSAGTINGAVTFGAGNDTLVAGWSGAGLVTGITGTINGGAGADTVRVRFSADATVRSALTLPTGFERISLAPDAQITATLADGFAIPGLLSVTGNGTVINRTTLSGETQVVQVGNDFATSAYSTFINAGTIATTAGTSGTFALVLGSNVSRFENSGTVSATGSGVSSSMQGSFVNTATGTIAAAGTGVSLFGPSFSNAGTIRSTGGTGVILSGSSGSNWTNSGRIEGATAGARISSMLINTGTIASTGTGVLVDNYGVLDNRAGGTIIGGVASASTSLFNATIANAGTIDGNVRLTGSSSSGSYNANRFFALAGGVVNGNLTLGASDVLVAEIAGSGAGRIAGIAGTVSGSDSLLRYRVRGDTAATLDTPAGFAAVGYDLYDGATLTLTGTAVQSSALYVPQLTLAGHGTVDLNATISANSQSVIQVTSLLIAPGETAPAITGLTITSRGALTLDHADTTTYPYAAVTLGGTDGFTNVGTITVRDRATTIYSPIYAIAGGKSVANSGTITLDAATGVSGAETFTNTGTISQAAGGRTATGVTGVTTLINSGTIDVAGNAVQLTSYYGGTITNSGRLASSGTAAIGVSDYATSYGITVTNQAGGTIVGGAGQAIRMAGGTLDNAGTITGSVDLGYASNGRSFLPATYVANGGTIAGDLRFGQGDDLFVAMDDTAGVSGTIDGDAGTDTYIHARSTTGTVTIGALTATGFEQEGVRALGSGTVVTIAAATPFAGDLLISGDGAIVNGATLNGAVSTGSFYNDPTAGTATLAAFTNGATIAGGFYGVVGSFTNSGTVGSATLTGPAVALDQASSFSNSGTIANNGQTDTVSLSGQQSATITNTGAITGGGLNASLYAYTPSDDTAPPPSIALTMTNGGTVTGGYQGLSLSTYADASAATVSLNNSGTIEATAQGGYGASLSAYSAIDDTTGRTAITLTNAGTIRSNAGGVPIPADPYAGASLINSSEPAVALFYGTSSTNGVQVSNASGGVIEASGALSTATLGYGALNLTNAGTIRGSAGATLSATDRLADYLGSTYLAGAIQTLGTGNDQIVNTGTITGSIALGAGNDRIENRGGIEGDVFLEAGDDSFLQQANAMLIGTVDGGSGTDGLIIDATGGGTVNGDQFINFERLSQVGQGNVNYLGTFRIDTIGVSGGAVTVAPDQTLASGGPVTLTGSDADESVTNNGTIAGSVVLGGGNDRLDNAGTIGGSVSLGDGDDAFVERPGSRVAGGVDGGAGNDVYAVALAGNRSGIGARTGFERLDVIGSGTLALTLDQDFASLTLAGTSIDLTSAGHSIGTATGSDAAETLRLDSDIANVALGGGDDTLALGTSVAAGRYDGGAGNDTLAFTTAAPVTLAGAATGFEQVTLAGGAVTVTGTLGSAGSALSFGAGDQQLVIGNGGTLAGTIDLGAGNDRFRLAAGGTLTGTVTGGTGNDTATIEIAGNRTLTDGITDFEALTTEGAGMLSLAGTHAFDRVTASGDLTILRDGALTAGQVQLGADSNRLTIAGGFAGSVDGGAGNDTIAVSGGSETAPVAFGTIANVEALSMTAGFATLAGNAALGNVDMSGGRLVGLAGSSLTAAQVLVRQGATFGSAGTVNGNVTVAGVLSPGASPGTMTVNGNVAIQAGSLSLFEIAPTVSDKLVVNGQVTIATGATLQLAPSGTLRPGTSYDLITASGGITGSYSTIIKPDTLFGFVVQRADRIQLLGQFLDNPGLSGQVSRSIAYANATLATQATTGRLFDALPALLNADGSSNAAAFARITPEAYASASQIGVDNALALSATARSPAFAASGDDVRPYTFAQTLGGWHRLGADPDAGTAMASSQSYGFLGGIGIGNATWSAGGFAGYLNDRQRIDALGARTKLDGFVAGIHGRYLTPGGLGITASILYDGGDAHTTRALPGSASASARYGLHSWVSDLSVSYALDVASDWALRPRAGVTYVRTTRDGVAETGGSPFALAVARDRHVAGFADAGLSFARSETSTAPLRPFVSLGVRYQIEGQRTAAVAGYAGGGLGLSALGAARAEVVGTAAGGIAYRLSNGLDLFSTVSSQTGRDDHQESITTGVRLRF